VAAKVLTFWVCAVLVCGPQEFADISEAPFAIDVNEIAVDPASHRRLCLGWAVVELGRTFTRTAEYCDPDGDPVTFAAAEYLSVDEAAGTYTLTLRPTAVGVTYYDVRLTDVVEAPRTPRARAGTFALAAVPANAPPVLGCRAVTP